MVLSCINTNRIRLYYEIGGYREFIQLVTTYYANGRTKSSTIALGEIGEILTYEIEEDISKRKYMALGSFVNVSLGSSGEIEYYIHAGIPEERLEYFRYENVYGYFAVQAKLKDDGLGDNLYRSGYVNQISESGYQQNITENVDRPLGSSGQKITIFNGEPIDVSFAAKTLSPYQLYRYGNNTYIVKIYNGSEEIIQAGTSAWRNTRYAPEPDLVEKRIVEATARKYEFFTKKIGSQGVEVLQVSGSPHKKVLWLVDIDEKGVEVKRESLFEFEVLPNQGIPFHRLDCLEAVVTDCPENTCEVVCGDTICCYNSNGISVLNFPANS